VSDCCSTRITADNRGSMRTLACLLSVAARIRENSCTLETVLGVVVRSIVAVNRVWLTKTLETVLNL
jgi:hypothetical protein